MKNKPKSWLEKHKNNFFSKDNLVGLIFPTILSVLITTLVTCLPFHPAMKSLKISEQNKRTYEKEFAIRYLPDLRAYVSSWNIYVGSGRDYERADDIIIIPLTICNKGLGLAKDIELKLCYNDGAMEQDKETSMVIPVLKGAESITIKPFFAPSILAGSSEKYTKRTKQFKMKAFLTWKEASGKEHKAVELFELDTTLAYSDSPSKFVLLSRGYYNDFENLEDFKKYADHKIDF